MAATSISDRQRILEIIAAITTGLGKLLFMNFLDWKLFFLITATLGWGVYIIYRYKKTDGILKYWGFRTDNFKKVLLKLLPFGILVIASSVIIGYFRETIDLNWHIIPILIIYPIWGIIQHFLMMGLLAGNLQDLRSRDLNKITIIVITATLFALVHYPYYLLILATFILALFYAYIYLNDRNIYVLGLVHGWLGGIFFYTVVGRDPFLEIFEKFIQ